MRYEERMEIAEMAYLRAVALIKELYEIRCGSTRYNKDYGEGLFYFESALQGVLMYASSSSGRLTPATVAFIQNNTLSGDFMRQINDVGMRRLYRKWEHLTWDNLLTHTMPVDRVLEIAREAIGSTVKQFVFPLADLDADINAKNYASHISAEVKKILMAVCSPDPSDTVGENADPAKAQEEMTAIVEKTVEAINAGVEIFNNAFLIYWKGSEKLD